jgi:trimethylamine:corrinoid methyltransferase-like protein
MGAVVRGSAAAYRARPCLVTAKETISPLFLDEHSGAILLALAKRGLPCTIIPMPITGLSAPATKLGCVVLGNAEILGVMTALFACCPEAVTGGGTISGVVDMQTGSVSFSAPEAILQDIAIAEVQQKLYGFNYLVGSGYTDAKYPNSQVLAEKTAKFLYAEISGRNTHPVGLLNSGSVFSAEQALVDIELCRYIQAHRGSIDARAQADGLAELIDSVGIRGNFLETEHTLRHHRENWFPSLFDRTSFSSLAASRECELYAAAHRKVAEAMQRKDFWQIDQAASREIDRIVAAADATL